MENKEQEEKIPYPNSQEAKKEGKFSKLSCYSLLSFSSLTCHQTVKEPAETDFALFWLPIPHRHISPSQLTGSLFLMLSYNLSYRKPESNSSIQISWLTAWNLPKHKPSSTITHEYCSHKLQYLFNTSLFLPLNPPDQSSAHKSFTSGTYLKMWQITEQLQIFQHQ